MKKLTLLVLSLLFILMLVSCVDYSALDRAVQNAAEPQPSESQEAMIYLSAYEELQDDNNALNDYVDSLLDEQETFVQEQQDLLEEQAVLTDALSAVELSVYRSVISREGLTAYFGMITDAKELGNGDVILTVKELGMTNEKFDASLYGHSDIEKIYNGLALEELNTPLKTLTVAENTIVAYNGAAYPKRDDGLYAYILGEIQSAKAQYDAAGAGSVVLPGPVFIFLAEGETAVMVLEK